MNPENEPTLDGRASGTGREGATPDLPGRKLLPAPLRRRLRRQILAVLSRSAPAPDYDTPVGDPGLFGPGSITWKIHADFPSMMVGGVAALLLQSLHPLALAGVWDHSSFRRDVLGRLRNTTAFVARTTYAPRAPAEAAIARVVEIHHQVRGIAPDGRPYRADDPELLAWVHCAECWGFLQAYQRICRVRIPPAQQDRYLQEMARVAEALGARALPGSLAELHAFFDRVRPELRFDVRTAEVLRILAAMPLPIPLAGPSRRVFIGAAAALLPGWALDLMGRPASQRLLDRASAGALRLAAPSIRDAMGEGGLAWRACRRVGADYAGLFRWKDDRAP
ncbi:MAG TPA: oxygenase MpaB family protein [Ottowia sp.]|uniref:oxygenase MpaB family protein n=1 Tax=Ottowia sp. TaxID=1898956 RepID=UPI002D0929C1|nr:oxygenase MpaB family protein [Ottowia sp.]HMN22244.1 oxygenase MpaB family protein [Ottowia sp.]